MTTSCMRRMTTPCTIHYYSPAAGDDHNDPTDSYTDVATNCVIQQRNRNELGAEAQIGVGVWAIYLAPDEQLPMAADTITLPDGLLYQFWGDCWYATALSGLPDHIEGSLMRAA